MDALDGTYELCELVTVQVGGAPDGVRQTHEQIWNVPKAVDRIR